MTHEECAALKPGDLIEHREFIYWFDREDWIDTNRIFVVLSVELYTTPGVEDEPDTKGIHGVQRCTRPDPHDFKFDLLYEGKIVKLVLCPNCLRHLTSSGSN